MSNRADYTVGWVCALSKEFTAAKAILDENHPQCPVPDRDTNQYALGKIGKHNVVIAVLPDGEYGLSSAANVATNMLNAFTNIRKGLLVGIGGGAPTSQKDIRLGDVVASSAGQGTGGIFQYDFRRTVQGMEFQTTGFLHQAPTAFRTAISALKTEHDMKGRRIQETICQGLERCPKLKKKYPRSPRSHDRLYLSTSVHLFKDCRTCVEACGEGTVAEPKLVKRADRSDEEDNPEIHYGIIASANQHMKDAEFRDKLSSEEGIICFEMEAAGQVNHVTLSPDSTKLAVIYSEMTEIYDLSLGKLTRLFGVSRDSEFIGRFSRDSNFFFFHHADNHLSVLDACEGVSVLDSYAEHSYLDMSFSDDSQWLAVASTPRALLEELYPRNARILISKKAGDTFRLEHTIERPNCYHLSEVRFSSNAKFLATLDRGKRIVLVWDPQKPLDELYVIERCCSIVAFSRSFLVVECSDPTRIDVWHIKSRRCYTTLGVKFGCYFTSPSERLLAAGSDGSVTIYDLEIGVPLVEIWRAYTSTRGRGPEPLIFFQPGDAGIRTPRGIFEIPKEILAPPSRPSHPTAIYHTPLSSVCGESGWVEWQGKRLLKLPAEYDPYTVAVSDSQIFITLASRRLVRISFRESQLFDTLVDTDRTDISTEGI